MCCYIVWVGIRYRDGFGVNNKNINANNPL